MTTVSDMNTVVTAAATAPSSLANLIEYDQHGCLLFEQTSKPHPRSGVQDSRHTTQHLSADRFKSNRYWSLHKRRAGADVPTWLQDMVSAVQRQTLAARSRYHHSKVSGHKAGGFGDCDMHCCSPCKTTTSNFSTSTSSSDCPSVWGWSVRHAAKKVQAAQASTLPGCHCVPDSRQLCNSSSSATSCPAVHAELGAAGVNSPSTAWPAAWVLYAPESDMPCSQDTIVVEVACSQLANNGQQHLAFTYGIASSHDVYATALMCQGGFLQLLTTKLQRQSQEGAAMHTTCNTKSARA